jgi:hypothetical protein
MAFRVGIVLVGCRRCATQTASRRRRTRRWRGWERAGDLFDRVADRADTTRRVAWNKRSWCIAEGQTSASTAGYRRESP